MPKFIIILIVFTIFPNISFSQTPSVQANLEDDITNELSVVGQTIEVRCEGKKMPITVSGTTVLYIELREAGEGIACTVGQGAMPNEKDVICHRVRNDVTDANACIPLQTVTLQ
jgi:hypothetical protein